MKAFVVLSLFAVACNAVTMHALSEISGYTPSVAVTANWPVGDDAPTGLTLTYPTTWNSITQGSSLFAITGSVTFVGNNTIEQIMLTFSSGSDSVVMAVAPTATAGFVATLAGGGYPQFLVTGTYSVSAMAYTYNQKSYALTATPALANVAATAYVPPAFTAFNLINFGCDDTGCPNSPNGTATIATARTGQYVDIYARPTTASTGVIYYFQAATSSSTGVSDFNDDTQSSLTAAFGGWQFGRFDEQGSLPDTLLPKTNTLVLSGALGENFFSTRVSEATFAGLQSSITSSVGSTDTTAPTCTVATLAPTTVNTDTVSVPVTVTITCSDENGGSGLYTKGAFATVTTSLGASSTFRFAQFGGATTTFDVPPYLVGTFSLAGVFAVDNAGNVALYGSCAGAVGWDTFGCGGSSSASTVGVSIFALAVLAIVSFFN